MEIDFLSWLQKKLTVAVILSVFLFMIVEFVILSSVGTIGPKLSSIRTEREQIRLENEIKQSQIRELQTSKEVSKTVNKDLGMQQKQVNSIQYSQPDEDTLAANF